MIWFNLCIQEISVVTKSSVVLTFVSTSICFSFRVSWMGYGTLAWRYMYNLCLTWYWTSVLWSIDSCKTGYPPTSIIWLYCGLGLQFIEVMLKFSGHQLLVFNKLIIGSVPLFFRRNSNQLFYFIFSTWKNFWENVLEKSRVAYTSKWHICV